jgi:hypothetical protein
VRRSYAVAVRSVALALRPRGAARCRVRRAVRPGPPRAYARSRVPGCSHGSRGERDATALRPARRGGTPRRGRRPRSAARKRARASVRRDTSAHADSGREAPHRVTARRRPPRANECVALGNTQPVAVSRTPCKRCRLARTRRCTRCRSRRASVRRMRDRSRRISSSTSVNPISMVQVDSALGRF